MKSSISILLTLGTLISIVSGCNEPTGPAQREVLTTPPKPTPPIPVTPASSSGPYIYLANASGGSPHQLARGLSPAWSPDGTKIAFDHRGDGNTYSGIYVMNADGTAQRPLTSASWGTEPRWSPDGSKIAFSTFIPSYEDGPFPSGHLGISVISADGSNETSLAGNGYMQASSAEWSADGKKIAFVGGKGSSADLYVIDPDRTNLTKLTQMGMVSGAGWSPDGRRLALHAAGAVYVVNADGSNLTQLTNDTDSLVVRSVVWSPRGDRIAFSLSPELVRETKDPESLKIHVINADGTNRTSVASNARDPRWLPDGRTLSFDRWFVDEIWIVPADGGEASRLLPGGVAAAWSPEGTRIAYVKFRPE